MTEPAEPIRISTFALWCEPCQMWWPGSIPIGIADDTISREEAVGDSPGLTDFDLFGGIRPLTPAEELEHAKYCPECGTRLQHSTRPYYRSEDGHR